MPNHIHGIIVINSPDINIANKTDRGDAINRVPAPDIPIPAKIPAPAIPAIKISTNRGGITGKHNPMLSSHSLGKIIRWYKGRCTFETRSIKTCPIAPEFAWQSRFHDYIIRDELILNRIRNYIVRNPETWKGCR
ncbi:hypothetical protein H6G89_06010 [Oscillatoria sp. FACHB-1407]|uniref:transposase n=1 Tax=Oscillatoria sp. FACHB-1407 TaxID=2692847 RepID=UPI001687EC55|nr:hypothetical protein [Oscillatoria sp. FACHB-1407]